MKRTMILSLSLAGVMILSITAIARPGYLQLFRRIEKPPAKSRLDKAACLTCHVKPGGGKILNPYGLDFKKNGANEESLKNIRALDSDSDGSDNASEISAGTLPGDARSKPIAK